MKASLILAKWNDFTARIIRVCRIVWEAVADVLCFDAPEGQEMDDEDALGIEVGPQDTLSFCWRALKESR